MFNISKADIHEFLSIASIDRTAWLENHNSEFIPDGEHAWRLWVEHALVFCARKDRNVVGAIVAFPCLQKDLFCVHKIFVEAKYRGQGIGKKLFKVLLEESDMLGVDTFLTVDPANNQAIRLYERFGYTEKKMVKGYYRTNEDRIVMTRMCEK